MADMVRLAGVCLLAVLLMQLLKGTNPTGAVLVLVGTVILLTSWGAAGLQNSINAWEQIIAWSGLQRALYSPVIKVIGIAAVVQVAGAVCKDSGASALASQLEIAGACAAIVVCLPLFEKVLVVVDALLE